MLAYDDVKPGDVLIYEDKEECLKVTVTEIDGNMLIIECMNQQSFLVRDDFERGFIRSA